MAKSKRSTPEDDLNDDLPPIEETSEDPIDEIPSSSDDILSSIAADNQILSCYKGHFAFETQTSQIQSALSMLKKIVAPSTRNTLPILDYVLISVTKTTMTLLLSNLEDTAEVNIPCKSDKEFKFVVEFADFLNMMLACTAEILSFEINDAEFVIYDGFNNYGITLSCNPDEFPRKPDLSIDKQLIAFTLAPEMVLSAFPSAVDFTADNQLRPILTGVFIETEENKIKATATDAHIMYHQRIDSDISTSGSFILSKSGVKAILFMAKENKEELLNCTAYEKSFVFHSGNVSYHGRIIEGMYPKYKTVVPTGYEFSVVANKKDLLNHLTKFKKIAGNSFSDLIILFTNEGLAFTSMADASFSGKKILIKTDINCDGYTFDKIGANIGFLVTTIQSFHSDVEEVKMNFVNPQKAITITSSEDNIGSESEFPNFRLVMPIFINE